MLGAVHRVVDRDFRFAQTNNYLQASGEGRAHSGISFPIIANQPEDVIGGDGGPRSRFRFVTCASLYSHSNFLLVLSFIHINAIKHKYHHVQLNTDNLASKNNHLRSIICLAVDLYSDNSLYHLDKFSCTYCYYFCTPLLYIRGVCYYQAIIQC